jgi:hypothetical protein
LCLDAAFQHQIPHNLKVILNQQVMQIINSNYVPQVVRAPVNSGGTVSRIIHLPFVQVQKAPPTILSNSNVHLQSINCSPPDMVTIFSLSRLYYFGIEDGIGLHISFLCSAGVKSSLDLHWRWF